MTTFKLTAFEEIVSGKSPVKEKKLWCVVDEADGCKPPLRWTIAEEEGPVKEKEATAHCLAR